MMLNKRQSGNQSETKALNFLKAKGFLLLERNFYVKGGEVDLICKDGEFIVFIEVKSLTDNPDRDIYSTLTPSKRKHLKKTINLWLLKNNYLENPWRFDFVGITIKNGVEQVEHFDFVSLD